LEINSEKLDKEIKKVKENLKNNYLNEIKNILSAPLKEDFVIGIKYIKKDNLPNW